MADRSVDNGWTADVVKRLSGALDLSRAAAMDEPNGRLAPLETKRSCLSRSSSWAAVSMSAVKLVVCPLFRRSIRIGFETSHLWVAKEADKSARQVVQTKKVVKYLNRKHLTEVFCCWTVAVVVVVVVGLMLDV
jgi:hypothetical protein